jgi:PTS system nitrogen regulatory IIA component
MTIKTFLSASDVLIDLQAATKSGLLKELGTRAASALNLPTDQIVRELEKRDELGSTGIGCGVCIPHARFREVKKPFGMLARLKQPIAYGSIDGQPVDIVFLLVLPAASQIDQLNALAAVARELRDREVLEKIRTATSSLEMYRAVAS